MSDQDEWIRGLILSQGRTIENLQEENRRLRGDPERDWWERRARSAESPEELMRVRHQYETRRRVR